MVVAWRRYGITSRNSIRVYRTFFPHKILRKNPDPECYSKEVKRLKIKARKAYNRRKLGEHHLEELKRLFKQLLAAKKTAQETFFRSILSKEGKCWPEFYKYVKRRKGYTENIPGIKDCNGRLIKDPIQKTNSFNYYYSSVFSNEVTPNIYSAPTQAYSSPLILKSLGKG